MGSYRILLLSILRGAVLCQFYSGKFCTILVDHDHHDKDACDTESSEVASSQRSESRIRLHADPLVDVERSYQVRPSTLESSVTLEGNPTQLGSRLGWHWLDLV
ncbi:uncharacterized protein F5147DRAFT_375167 [Suillus discolor]|uniref:Secreted protein n=1 Tax=Suillus discolor TaxID=1912936 RepID=A0A9P7EZ53_9AGAM|nr:uncharacterized protein F5147DRAFT_375167 [Suillus discolor]KAG2096693.1 hypothetical protein F5147DRAFT_375167 [Suillus discolor]